MTPWPRAPRCIRADASAYRRGRRHRNHRGRRRARRTLLGYFIDPRHTGLGTFLSRQRAQRIARVEALGLRLAQLGMPIDIGPLLTQAGEQGGGRSVGRPQIAAAMIAAGYVADTRAAFDRWLATGRPAFVSTTWRAPSGSDRYRARRGWSRIARPSGSDGGRFAHRCVRGSRPGRDRGVSSRHDAVA